MILLALVLATTQILAADAQSRRPSGGIVRDAEIEALIRDYTVPILRAAGLQRGAVDIYVLNDTRFNAFATGKRIVIHTGAIVQAESPNEIIGVMAHETGHIVGGHLARLRDRLDRARGLMLMSVLAGAAAGAFGGDAGGAIGQGLALGGQSAIVRDLLAYSRSEEAAADNMAFSLLEKTGQSSRGMLTTFERFARDSLFSGSRVDPYLQSHPMPRERIMLLRELAQKSPYYDRKDPPALQLRHDMARAKILAYTGHGGQLSSVFRNDPQGAAARYGLALALFLRGDTRQAVPMMDRLIAEQPNNPYLYEQKGEMLLRGGDAAGAAAQFRRAIALDPGDSGLLRISLGHALLETRGGPDQVRKAIAEIKAGLTRDPTGNRGYGLLARAHSALGEPALARAAAAEEAFYRFQFKEAKQLALLAQPNLKHGSPQWLRMQDIIDYKPPKKRR